eukprot:scaffold5929_cov101-Skeletonema_dohrnii-CCMP3373.AAC.6
MKPNPDERKWVAADSNCVKGAITKDLPPKLAQGRCGGRGGCGQQSSRVCSKCTHPTDPAQRQYFFCLPCKGKGKECNGWLKHLEWHKQNDAWIARISCI